MCPGILASTPTILSISHALSLVGSCDLIREPEDSEDNQASTKYVCAVLVVRGSISFKTGSMLGDFFSFFFFYKHAVLSLFWFKLVRYLVDACCEFSSC